MKSTLLLLALFFCMHANQSYTFKVPNSTKTVVSHTQIPPLTQGVRLTNSPEDAVDNTFWCLFSDRGGMENTTWIDLKKAGVQIEPFKRFEDTFVYQIITMNNVDVALAILKKDAKFVNVISVSSLDKISEQTISTFESNRTNSVSLYNSTVTFTRGTSASNKRAVFTNVGLEVVDNEDGAIKYVVGTEEQFLVLSYETAVQTIAPYYEKIPELNDAREFTGINELQKDLWFNSWTTPKPDWFNGMPYTGKGVVVTVNERKGELHQDMCHYVDGDTVIRTNDSDLNGWGFVPHGLHVGGIIGGNGWESQNESTPFMHRGVAPSVIFSRNEDEGHTNNHSFMYSDVHDWYSQHNDLTDDKYGRIGVFSAGNYQQKPKSPAGGGYYSLSKQLKNAIYVGAGYKDAKIIAPFSSSGPTDDGRIKPDIVAPGCGNYVENKKFPDKQFDGGTAYFDYIEIRNNGVKCSWDFTNDTDLWTKGSKVTITRDGNSMKLEIPSDGGYIFSPELSPSFVSHENDTLIIKWKSTINKEFPITFRWKTPSDSFIYPGHPYHIFVPILEKLTSSYQTTIIPLKETPWKDGLTIKKLGFWMAATDADNQVTSLGSPNGYTIMSGTSQAAPFVTGVTALMLEKYRDGMLAKYNAENNIRHNLRSRPFWNSTARGVLIHTADDMIDLVGKSNGYCYDTKEKTIYGKGPDWTTGWGYINGKRAVDYVNSDNLVQDTIKKGSTVEYFINNQSDDPFRVTLCWDDPGNNTSLVNDLDLKLVHEETGTIIKPWTLDPTPLANAKDGIDNISTSVIRNNPAKRGIDKINSVEVVDVENPLKGLWKIEIKATALSTDQNTGTTDMDQDFTLVTDVSALKKVEDHNNSNSFTIEEMLDFSASKSWTLKTTEAKLVPIHEKIDGKLVPNMKVIVDPNGAAKIQSGKKIDTFVGKNIENITIGIHLIFQKNPVHCYRGNLQLLEGKNWVGQFELNSYGPSIVEDKGNDTWNAYYEFVIPQTLAAKMNIEPVELNLRFSASKNPDEWFILRKLTFTDYGSDKEKVLWDELEKISVENGGIHSPTEIKAQSQEYDEHKGQSYPLYRVYYRKLVDPEDGIEKRFYYQIKQDVDAPMLFVEWWAFQDGYIPEVPWNSSSYWRQCWRFIGTSSN